MRTVDQLMLAITAVCSNIAQAQQVGNTIEELHPRLTTWRCTTAADSCTPRDISVVIDASFRWVHNIDGFDSCTTPDGGLNRTICPDAVTCARNCVLEGANYASLGVHTWSNKMPSSNGWTNSLTLDMYVDGQGFSPRVYLLGEDGNYEGLHLLNQELSFDVDMSKLPCGMNGALYLSEMSLSGGRSSLNSAGAAMGTGYCDAQCPVADFINGEANINSSGACCNEMDIWEADSEATAMTPHTCRIQGVYACTDEECLDGDSGGVCDKSGCVYNAYGQGYHGFYGPNGTVDTTQPFTVVTQFLTAGTDSDGKDTSDSHSVLKEIRRIYIQNSKVINDVSSTMSTAACGEARAGAGKNTSQAIVISDAFCGDSIFGQLGGLRGMGQALQRGMVLVFSIRNDNEQFMNWLDSDGAGPCDNKAGDPNTILEESPDTSVTWFNVRWGDIGSTFGRDLEDAR